MFQQQSSCYLYSGLLNVLDTCHIKHILSGYCLPTSCETFAGKSILLALNTKALRKTHFKGDKKLMQQMLHRQLIWIILSINVIAYFTIPTQLKSCGGIGQWLRCSTSERYRKGIGFHPQVCSLPLGIIEQVALE